MPPERSTEDRK